MGRMVRLYAALLRAEWARVLEYRAQVVVWLLAGVFPLVMLVVWLALVNDAGAIAGWDRSDFIAYYVGAAVIHQFTFAWVMWQWDGAIRTGELSARLLKPVDPFHALAAEQLSWKLFVLLAIVPVVGLMAWLSPTLNFNLTPIRAVLVAVSTGLGLALGLAMGCALGMIAFWTTQSNNLFGLWFGVGQFVSGWIAPLDMFPAGFRQLAYWLPFRSTLGLPAEILTGQLTGREIAFGLAVTLAWIVIFTLVYRWLWRPGLRQYEAVGA